MTLSSRRNALLSVLIVVLLLLGVTSVGLASDRPDSPAPLRPSAIYILDGTVSDMNVHWGLFATVTITPPGEAPTTIWTNPWSGAYSIELYGPATYTVTAQAWDGIPGYRSETLTMALASPTTLDFHLAPTVCAAPGYDLSEDLYDNFDGGGHRTSCRGRVLQLAQCRGLQLILRPRW